MTPRPRLLWLANLVLPVLIARVWMPPLAQLAIVLNLLLLSVALADWLISIRLKNFTVYRDVSEVLSVGARNPVTLTVRNRSQAEVMIELFDEFPQPGTASGLPVAMTLKPGQEQSREYGLRPQQRGRNAFKGVLLRTSSRLGLWTLQERRELISPVRILPDIRSISRYELLARQNRLQELGIKIGRLRGRGSNFDRLREYRREDELRQVDWKATARNQQLVSREFNVERNQNVLVVIDCGRSMRNESDGISYLDRALNASIMLSYIALGQGDNVGFMAFSNRIERIVKPVRGKPAVQTLLQQAFDLDARRETSDYALAIEHLNRGFRKRSLVILLTHSIDEQHLDAISLPLRTVRSPHLFLCVFLKDLGLAQLAGRIPETDVEAFQSAAAAEMLTAVERRTATLKEQGILTVSTNPQDLTATAINGYLEVKARHLI